MKLTLKDKDFLEKLKVLLESKELSIELKEDGVKRLVLRQNYGDKIQLIAQANGGVARARNAGLAQAKGEFVALLDADDVWTPEKTEQQIKVLQQLPEIALIGSGCHEIDSGGNIIGQVRHQIYENPTWFSQDPPILNVSDVNKNLLRNCIGAPSGVIFRRECLQKIEGFDRSLTSSEDWDFYLRFVVNFKVAVFAAPLYKYRILAGGLCSPENTEQLLKSDLFVLEKTLNSLSPRASWLHTRKAYGIRYFNHARAFMQNRQLSRARDIFFKAVLNWPALMFSKSAVFMLAAIVLGEGWLRKRQVSDAEA